METVDTGAAPPASKAAYILAPQPLSLVQTAQSGPTPCSFYCSSLKKPYLLKFSSLQLNSNVTVHENFTPISVWC